MALPRRLLTDGEQVVVELRPHWSVLGLSLCAAPAAAAGLMAIAIAWPGAPTDLIWALLALLVLSGLWLAARMVRRASASVVVTSARMVQRSGILGRRGLDIRLERVQEVSYHQTLFGRVIGCGELVVETGGARGVVVFDHMRRPASVAAVLQEQVTRRAGAIGDTSDNDAYPPVHVTWPRLGANAPVRRPVSLGHGDATPPAGTPAFTSAMPVGGSERSVAERLVDLDELRRRGLLSDAEYESKRAALVDRL